MERILGSKEEGSRVSNLEKVNNAAFGGWLAVGGRQGREIMNSVLDMFILRCSKNKCGKCLLIN